jgi:hypothetical protein
MAVVAASAGAKDVKPSDFLRTWQPQEPIDEQARLAALLAWAGVADDEEGD